MRLSIAAAVAAVLVAAWTAPAQSPPESTRGLEDLSRAFRHAYEQAKPAVVLIATARTWRLPRFHPQVPEDEYQGMGSGTIVSTPSYRFGYYGWPSACTSPDGRVLAMASGMRQSYVYPFGEPS